MSKPIRIAHVARLCNLKSIGPATYVAKGMWTKSGVIKLQKEVDKVAIPEGLTCVCSSQSMKGVVTFY